MACFDRSGSEGDVDRIEPEYVGNSDRENRFLACFGRSGSEGNVDRIGPEYNGDSGRENRFLASFDRSESEGNVGRINSDRDNGFLASFGCSGSEGNVDRIEPEFFNDSATNDRFIVSLDDSGSNWNVCVVNSDRENRFLACFGRSGSGGKVDRIEPEYNGDSG